MTPLFIYDVGIAAALLLGAVAIQAAKTSIVARRWASAIMVVAALAMGLAALDLFGWASDPAAIIGGALRSADTSVLALVACVIGLVATAMSPATTAKHSFGTILALIAIDILFIESDSAPVLAALWGLSGLLLWWESRAVCTVSARLVAAYHLPSFVLMALGAWFVLHGDATISIICIAAGIAIREAVFPLHGWLTKLFERLPMGVVVAFAAPQLGIHAHLHFFAAGLPQWHNWIAILGAVTAVMAAALGTIQKNARRAVAFLFISQSGLIAFGLENHSDIAQAGVLVSWQVIALATSGFAMTVAALGARRASLILQSGRGNFAATPRLASAFLLTGFASVGLPLSLGFVAEDLLVQGAIDEFPLMGLALIVATGLNGITVVRAYLALFCGANKGGAEADLVPRELATISLVLALLLLGGLFPSTAIRMLRASDSSGEVVPTHQGHIGAANPQQPSEQHR